MIKKLQRSQEALAVCDHAIQPDPSHALVHTIKGKVLSVFDLKEESVIAFEQGLQLYLAQEKTFTATAAVFSELGRTLFVLKCYIKAHDAYDQKNLAL